LLFSFTVSPPSPSHSSSPTRRSSDLDESRSEDSYADAALCGLREHFFRHPLRLRITAGKLGGIRLGKLFQQESLAVAVHGRDQRSEEHTSELQSLTNLVCRLLLE